MSGRHDEIFAFDSAENVAHEGASSYESINFEVEDSDNLSTPMNYQTVRRIEHAKSLLRNHSLLAYQSMQTGETICLIRAKLKAKLNPKWTPEKENELFSGEIKNCRDYTIVTPSHNFIEIDDDPHNGSFASSYGAAGSYKSFSIGSFKSPDRLKHYKNL